MMTIYKLKFSNFFFLIAILIASYPILHHEHFVTMDGDTHSNNAFVFTQLIFGDSFLSQFYDVNMPLPPNSLGHIMLSFFQLIVPAASAEKVVVLLILIFQALGIKKYINAYNSVNWLTIIPVFFGYSFLLALGFYNFSLGLAILFFAFHSLQKTLQNTSRKNTIMLGLIILSLYFSHLFVFLIFGLYTCVFWICKAVPAIKAKDRNFSYFTVGLIAAFLPSLIFWVLNSNPYNEVAISNKTSAELWEELKMLRPFISYNLPKEANEFTYKVMNALLIGTILQFIITLTLYRERLFKWSDNYVLLIVSLICLAFYFYGIDQYGNGGYIQIRFGLFALLFFIIYLLVTIKTSWIALLMALYILKVHYHRAEYYGKEVMAGYSETMAEMKSHEKHLEQETTLLPLLDMKNWLLNHPANILGTEKKVVVLENYECMAENVFPLEWSRKTFPKISLPNKDIDLSALGFPFYFAQESPKKEVDYILLWNRDLIPELTAYYTLINETKNSKLYKIKRKYD